MKVLSVGIPLHLQILLAQRMRKQLHAAVCDHGLVRKRRQTNISKGSDPGINTQTQTYRVYSTVTVTVTFTGTTTVRTGTVGDDLVSSQNTICGKISQIKRCTRAARAELHSPAVGNEARPYWRMQLDPGRRPAFDLDSH